MTLSKPWKALVAASTLGSALGLAGCSSMRNLFEQEVDAELARITWEDSPVFTEVTLAGLPDPVKRHFQVCGLMGRKAPKYGRVVWSGLSLKLARDKDWKPLRTLQFNSVQEPVRIVYMGARMMKVLPFEGRDKYQDGHGNMRIKVMRLFTVVDEKNPQMDASALVTVLAEALLVPTYVLQPYIRWEPMDATQAKAILEFNKTTVEGVFHFASTGECIRFDTDSRWQKSTDPAPVPWSAYLEDYRDMDGIRFPSTVRAAWHEKSGDFEYAKGRIDRIEYDVPYNLGSGI